jgi:hypothetical protein
MPSASTSCGTGFQAQEVEETDEMLAAVDEAPGSLIDFLCSAGAQTYPGSLNQNIALKYNSTAVALYLQSTAQDAGGWIRRLSVAA